MKGSSQFSVRVSISDNCFTNIYPGKILPYGSQTHILIQKLRFIFDCMNIYFQKFYNIPETTFPLQSCTSTVSAFHFPFTLS